MLSRLLNAREKLQITWPKKIGRKLRTKSRKDQVRAARPLTFAAKQLLCNLSIFRFVTRDEFLNTQKLRRGVAGRIARMLEHNSRAASPDCFQQRRIVRGLQRREIHVRHSHDRCRVGHGAPESERAATRLQREAGRGRALRRQIRQRCESDSGNF